MSPSVGYKYRVITHVLGIQVIQVKSFRVEKREKTQSDIGDIDTARRNLENTNEVGLSRL